MIFTRVKLWLTLVAFLVALTGVSTIGVSPVAAQSMRVLSCTIDVHNPGIGGGIGGSSDQYTFVMYEYHSDCGYFGSGNVGVSDWANYCGSSQYAMIRADPWTTNQPWYGGSRYNDPGRSPFIGVPNDCYTNYYLRQTNGGGTPTPKWGCSWYNVSYPNAVTWDDLCYFIQS